MSPRVAVRLRALKVRIAPRLAQYGMAYDGRQFHAVKFAILRSVETKTDTVETIERGLLRAMRCLCPSVARQLDEPVRGAARIVSQPSPRDSAHPSPLVDAISRLSPDDAAAEEWLRLRYLLMVHGFIEAGALARKFASHAALEQASAKPSTPERVALGALFAMESGDYSQAERLYAQARMHADVGPRLDEMSWLLALLSGDRDRFIRLAASRRAEADESMRALVEGRSVALVGPSPNPMAHGAAIDGNDIVARLVYIDDARIGDEAMVGTRTDISYYGTPDRVENILPRRDGRIALPTHLKQAVSNGRSQQYIGPVRDGFRPRIPVLFGLRPNKYQKIQFAAYDLLFFNPSSITVYNTNFYLASNANLYSPGHVSSRTANSSCKAICAQFGRHDPIGNWKFIKRLWRLGYLDGDSVFRNVLANSSLTYARALDRNLGRGQWI